MQHLDNAGATIWSYHPIAAAAAAVWIQIGIGLWLLAAPRGDWSRLGGVASVGWGLIVWVFGEAFGGIFAPGLTWLFGAPGAVLFYCLAGALIALPERYWATPRLGRIILRVMGLFFVGMAVLQAWPGRGFWQGQTRHAAAPGTLTAMVQQMAQTPQPHLLSSWVAGFAGFDAAHGWAVNLFAVIALAAIGATFLIARPRPVRLGVIAGVVLVPGRLGAHRGLRVLRRGRHRPQQHDPHGPALRRRLPGYHPAARRRRRNRSGRARPPCRGPGAVARALGADPTYAFRSVAALGAIGITLVGAAPMAWPPPTATPTRSSPRPSTARHPAPTPLRRPSHLVDQHGRPVSLASLHGKAIALTFLDPVCTSDCPIIAQEFRMADGVLGADARRVELVAIDANPRYLSPDFLAAFDQQERLEQCPQLALPDRLAAPARRRVAGLRNRRSTRSPAEP